MAESLPYSLGWLGTGFGDGLLRLGHIIDRVIHRQRVGFATGDSRRFTQADSISSTSCPGIQTNAAAPQFHRHGNTIRARISISSCRAGSCRSREAQPGRFTRRPHRSRSLCRSPQQHHQHKRQRKYPFLHHIFPLSFGFSFAKVSPPCFVLYSITKQGGDFGHQILNFLENFYFSTGTTLSASLIKASSSIKAVTSINAPVFWSVQITVLLPSLS